MEYFGALSVLTSTIIAYQDSFVCRTGDNYDSSVEYGEDDRADGGAGGSVEGPTGDSAGGSGEGLAGDGAAVSRADKSRSASDGWSSGNSLTVINLQKHDQSLVWTSLCI